MGKRRKDKWKRDAFRYAPKDYVSDPESFMARRAEREQLAYSKRHKAKRKASP